MAPAHLERHHDAHLPPVGLELHHEPAYLDLTEARTRTRVRVLGLALRIPVPRPRAQLVLALVVLVVGLGITAAATAGLLADGHGRYVLAAAARSVAAPKGRWTFAPQTVPHATAARVPPPVYLTIPAIGVRTRLIRLGLTHSGGLQAPGTTAVAGWYTGSPPPGAVGAAVIGGHVDSYVGPGVFFTLRLLHPGDRIYVRQAGGRLAVFGVNAVHRYLKARFPTAQVYGPVPTPQLRLLTCGGTFDFQTGHYLSNVVVYATLIPAGS